MRTSFALFAIAAAVAATPAIAGPSHCNSGRAWSSRSCGKADTEHVETYHEHEARFLPGFRPRIGVVVNHNRLPAREELLEREELEQRDPRYLAFGRIGTVMRPGIVTRDELELREPYHPHWVHAAQTREDLLEREDLEQREPFRVPFRVGTVMRPGIVARDDLMERDDLVEREELAQRDLQYIPYHRIGALVRPHSREDIEA